MKKQKDIKKIYVNKRNELLNYKSNIKENEMKKSK